MMGHQMNAFLKTTTVSKGLQGEACRAGKSPVGNSLHRVTRWFVIAIGGLVLFANPSSSFAVDVSDAGHFFSAEALEKANAAIREIEKKTGHDIRIETHATVPSDKIDAVAKMDRAQRQEFMNNWTLDRAKTVKENGTLILICKEPAYAKTWFSGKLKSAGLTQSDCNQVSETLLAGLKAKNNDAALKDTISRLGDSYSQLRSMPSNIRVRPATARHAPGAAGQADAPRQAPFSWAPVISIIGMVLIGIFVISLLSRLFSGGGYGGYGGQPGYGGGGGFMSSLAGGLFGAVAGNWLYDAFSGHSAHARDSAAGADTMSGDGSGSDSSGNSDWTDEGSSSGGGWFDGRDSGGGDFGGGGGFDGGGDFGGGGDF